MKPKITVTKNLQFFPDQKERLESLGDVTYHNEPCDSAEEWLRRAKDADIVCSGMFGFNTEKLYELNDVFISVPFVGVEFLDKDKLKERNTNVANAPGCNKEAVAEWIIGMMIMYFRNLQNVANTETLPKEEILKTGKGLSGKKITILGTGSIGTHLGKICESFGMEVSFFRRGEDLIESVKDADIVANCLSSNESTKGILDRKFFISLKQGSFFASITRPQVYDIEALKEALDKDILFGAIDDNGGGPIGDTEDSQYQELLKHPKISVTPHVAWNSETEIRNSNDIMIDNIEAWLKNEPINLVN